MAQLTLTLADADVDRVVTSFERRFGARNPEVETKAEFVKRHIQMSIDRLVLDSERETARENAEQTHVPLEWS